MDFGETPPVPIKEKIGRQKNLGKLFENKIASLSKDDLPPVIEELVGAPGFITTNEDLTLDTIDQVIENPPDGYIFGGGFGNILSMTFMFRRDADPKALLCVDVLPEVVVGGRIFTSILANAENSKSLFVKLKNKEEFKKHFAKVVAEEESPLVQERLNNVDIEKLHEQMSKFLMLQEYEPVEGIRQEAFGGGKKVNLIAAIKAKFDVLQKLAQEGNIGTALADITNPNVLEAVKELPDFESSSNLIYMSNIIDHLIDRGGNLSRINDLDVLRSLGEEKNWFVHTTQNQHNYDLQASRFVPQYSAEQIV